MPVIQRNTRWLRVCLELAFQTASNWVELASILADKMRELAGSVQDSCENFCSGICGKSTNRDRKGRSKSFDFVAVTGYDLLSAAHLNTLQLTVTTPAVWTAQVQPIWRSVLLIPVSTPVTDRRAGGRGSTWSQARILRSGGHGACERCAWHSRDPGQGRGLGPSS